MKAIMSEGPMKAKIASAISGMKEEMVTALMSLVSIPAVNPVSIGGDEKKKAAFVERICREIGFDEILHYDAPSSLGPRPNLIAKLRGKNIRSGRL